jgi:O-methyltransferase involved in polyketide biosynthesis
MNPVFIQMTQENKPYPTAQVTPDAMGLGRTSGQRGAEILAGLRAELFPTPETVALARWSSRMIANVFTRLEKSKAALNYVAVRPNGMTELVTRALSPDRTDQIVVDIAAGFSPRGIQLANRFPNLNVIEIDLPDVVKDKQLRLRTARTVTIPRNMSWKSADLGVTPLADVLEGQLVDVVVAEGLTAYFTPKDNQRIASLVRESLRPGGKYICDITWEEGMQNAKEATRFFSRQAGKFLGMMKDEAAMKQLMLDAGYSSVEVVRPAKLAAEIGLPTPVMEFSFFVVATR